MIQIIGPFFWTELTELNHLNMTHRIGPSLKNMTHRIWTLLFNMSQRKWLHFWSWLKDCFFLHIWLKEQWSFWWNNDSKNWTFFTKSKNWSFFYQYDSLQEFKPFEPFHLTQRIEHFLEYDSKNWTCFKMTQRIEPCLKMTQRI